MSKNIQAIRGMNDCLPSQTAIWQYVEHHLQETVARFGYSEIRTPILESTHLFKRSIGEVTDIVEKEMYTFDDRNGDSLTLRPEGTACAVRAGIQHGLLYNQQQRLWYMGPMFRHERPQKGRYRQFHQFGAEAYGLSGPDIDIEMIMIGAAIWKAFGISEHITLQLNSLGSSDARAKYKAILVEFLNNHFDELDEDSQRRVSSNPLRVLDSKNPKVQEVIEHAPKLFDHLDEESKKHFTLLCERLGKLGIQYEVNPQLVRGLDYYNQTVFEWVTDALGAQGTVCAGGRYDGLVKQLGGSECPAIGFAMGIERLVLLMESISSDARGQTTVDVYVASIGAKADEELAMIVSKIRNLTFPNRIMMHCGGGSVKKIMKRADNSGARYAVLIGDTELESHTLSVKDLRERAEQKTMTIDELAKMLKHETA